MRRGRRLTYLPCTYTPNVHVKCIRARSEANAMMATDQPHDEVEAPPELQSIGGVARQLGLTPRTIRYYEELGLLRPAVRVKGADRLFDATDVQRLGEIKRLREVIGFSLAEIAELFDTDDMRAELRERFHGARDPQVRRQTLLDAVRLADQRLSVFQRKLTQVAALRDTEVERLAHIHQLLAADVEGIALETTEEGVNDE